MLVGFFFVYGEHLLCVFVLIEIVLNYKLRFILNKWDRYIRPKPDDRINKNHKIKYFLPYDRINKKTDGQVLYISTSV